MIIARFILWCLAAFFAIRGAVRFTRAYQTGVAGHSGDPSDVVADVLQGLVLAALHVALVLVLISA
jgi:hypothetical protein